MRYISNRLDDNEREALRLQLLADPELSDSFAEMEAERIDALAAGLLPPAEASAMHAYLRETGQQSRLAIAAALAQPRRSGFSPYAIGLALAAVLLLTFPLLRVSRESRMFAPAVMTVPLLPGTLRGAETVQQIRRQPGRIDLQLQYVDAAPTGECRIVLEGITSISDCGANELVFPMPFGLASGRHRIDLIYNGGSERIVYFFDLVD